MSSVPVTSLDPNFFLTLSQGSSYVFHSLIYRNSTGKACSFYSVLSCVETVFPSSQSWYIPVSSQRGQLPFLVIITVHWSRPTLSFSYRQYPYFSMGLYFSLKTLMNNHSCFCSLSPGPAWKGITLVTLFHHHNSLWVKHCSGYLYFKSRETYSSKSLVN